MFTGLTNECQDDIEKSKRQFEFEVERMKTALRKLSGILNCDLLEVFDGFIDEYEDHFKDDIEMLISEHKCLLDAGKEPTIEAKPETRFDVIAVNITTGEKRLIIRNRSKEKAEAIVTLQVMQKGMATEVFESILSGTIDDA